MKINKFETRFILFLFIFSIACQVALNLNTNTKTSITNSINNKLNSYMENLLKLNTNSITSTNSFNSSTNKEKIQDDSTSNNSEINGTSEKSIVSEGPENLITDLEPEERAQSESTATVGTETNTKDPLKSRDNKRFKLTTNKTTTDKGNILRLAQFDVRCPLGEVLSGYHMWGESNFVSSNQIGIEFNCVKIPKFNSLINKVSYKVTKEIEVQGDLKDALLIITKKDLNIECPDGKILSRFAYTSVNNKGIGLQNTCIDAKVKDCKSVFTKEENIRTYNGFGRCINQYSQFYIEAEPGKVLQKIRHFKVNEDTMKIYITSCTLDYTESDQKKNKEEEDKKIKEEEKKKKEEEEKKKKDLQINVNKDEEEKKNLIAKNSLDEKKAKELKEQQDKLNHEISKATIQNNEKAKQIENSKAVINKMASTIANNEIKKQERINTAKEAGALLLDNQKKVIADQEKALKNINEAKEENKNKKKEEDRLLNKLLTLRENLKILDTDIKKLNDEYKNLENDKNVKEKEILNSKNQANNKKLNEEIKNILKRMTDIEKILNTKRPIKIQTEIDIKNLERSLTDNKIKTHEVINKEIEAQKEIKKTDEQVKIIEKGIKENVNIEGNLRKDLQDISKNDKKLEQQLAEEKNKAKKLIDEEVKAKLEAEILKNEAEKKQLEEKKVKESLEQTNNKIKNNISPLLPDTTTSLKVFDVTPLKDKTQEIQHNKSTNEAVANGNNSETEKIDKNLGNKNVFCAIHCYDDNQNTNNTKKCYLNGEVKNCFSCKIKEVTRKEKAKDIEKICMNFCNHVENTPNCLYFGYVNKNKKQIDIDPKILIELGLKIANKKLRNYQ